MIPLPDGFQPEGIVTGRGTSFYVGSLRDGATSTPGLLFSVDPATGVARTVDLGGASLECGDGLLRRGRTLYAVQGASNQIAVVRLGSSPTSGASSGRSPTPTSTYRRPSRPSDRSSTR